jgi:hypothetical protein
MRNLLVICLAFSLSVIPVLPKDNYDVAPPGNWGAVESLKKDSAISVRMTSGERLDGDFQKLDPDAIRLKVDKQEKILPRSVVAEIWRHRAPDRKLNGILIGMGVGTVAGIGAAKAVGAEFRGKEAYGIMFAMAGLGFGALMAALRTLPSKEISLYIGNKSGAAFAPSALPFFGVGVGIGVDIAIGNRSPPDFGRTS